MKSLNAQTKKTMGIVFTLCTIFFLTMIFPQNTAAQTVPVRFVGAQPVTVVGGPGSQAEVDLVKLVKEIRDKELSTDRTALALQQSELAKETREQIAYINSGYQDGNPFFIQSLELLVQRTQDNVAGQASDELVDSEMCDAFKYEVIKQIKLEYQQTNVSSISDQSTCALADKTDGDIESFIEDGNFESGGWGAFFTMITNPENTPVGAKLAQQERIREETAEQTENVLRRADWSSGFLDLKICEEDIAITASESADPNYDPFAPGGPANSQTTTTNTDTVIREKCTVTNPGVLIMQKIANQLQLQANAGFEMDPEFFTEVANSRQLQLANTVFSSGNNGLMGKEYTPDDLTPDPNPDNGTDSVGCTDDLDCDQIPNAEDTTPRGPGSENTNGLPGCANDLDCDGVSNAEDTTPQGPSSGNNTDTTGCANDLDCDGVFNNTDSDRDGDNLPNEVDPDPDGKRGGNTQTCTESIFAIIFNKIMAGLDINIDISICDLSSFNFNLFDNLSSAQAEMITKNISFQEAIINTLAVLEYQLQIASAFDIVEEQYTKAKTPYENDPDQCWDLDFPQELTATMDANQGAIPISIATTLALEALEQEYEDATFAGQSTKQIFDDFIALMEDELIGNEVMIVKIKKKLNEEIKPAISEFSDDIISAENACK